MQTPLRAVISSTTNVDGIETLPIHPFIGDAKSVSLLNNYAAEEKFKDISVVLNCKKV